MAPLLVQSFCKVSTSQYIYTELSKYKLFVVWYLTQILKNNFWLNFFQQILHLDKDHLTLRYIYSCILYLKGYLPSLHILNFSHTLCVMWQIKWTWVWDMVIILELKTFIRWSHLGKLLKQLLHLVRHCLVILHKITSFCNYLF